MLCLQSAKAFENKDEFAVCGLGLLVYGLTVCRGSSFGMSRRRWLVHFITVMRGMSCLLGVLYMADWLVLGLRIRERRLLLEIG